MVLLDSLDYAEINDTDDVHYAPMDSPPYWILLKAKLNFQRSQILSDSHQNQHSPSSDQCAQKLLSGVFSFETVWPLQPIKFAGEGGKRDTRSYLGNGVTYQN